jgi:hypothetical protein
MGAYNDDVLFIHIPKTGGWSVKQYMAKVLPDVLWPDPERPETLEASKLPIGHVRLADIERFTGRPLDSWKLVLAVLRDPYEQQLSQWSFWRDRYARGDRHIHDVVAAAYPTLTAWLEDPRCDFDVWYMQHVGYPDVLAQRTMKWQESPEGQNRYSGFGGCYWFWLEVDGKIPDNVTTIDVSEIGQQVPRLLKPFASGEAAVEKLNTSPHGRKTSDYYTPRAAQLVEEKFAWTFERELYPRWYYSDVV